MKLKYIISFLFVLNISNVQAKSYPVLADVESMQWLQEKAQPLLESAGIEEEVNYRIINSYEVNAFVTPDRNINFFNGLIEKAETQDEVISVLAHEIGHLKGFHHFRMAHKADQFTLPTILSGVAGIGAAVAGAPQAGMALILGGQAASVSQMLRYSRTQEREADHIAYDLLKKNEYSLQGLIDFFATIKQSNLLYSRTPPPYLLSHPLTSERVDAARIYQDTLLEDKNFKVKKTSKSDEDSFMQMKARLFALTHKPTETFRKFPAIDKTNPAVYARSIAYALQGKGKEAIRLMQGIIKKDKNNPFFYDMLGQIYVDIGELNKGVRAFEKSLNIKPELVLTRLMLAEAYLALEEFDKSYDNFSIVRHKMPKWPSVWHGLGIVYGKKGYTGEGHLALAEEALLKQDINTAKFHIKAAESYQDDISEPAKKWLTEVKNALKEK